MDVREHLRNGLRAALAEAGIDPLPDDIALERPANRDHGDWSSNIALATAKNAGKNPRELGQALVDFLNARPPAHVTTVEIAGPGFVNFRLADTWLHEVMTDVLEQGVDGYASPDLGAGAHLNVEFVSANPTGPLHVGHGRGAAVGDVLARLYDASGWAVTREVYYNDAGVQIDNLTTSVAARCAGLSPADADWPEAGYRGEYLADVAAAYLAGETVTADDREEGKRLAMEQMLTERVTKRDEPLPQKRPGPKKYLLLE